MDMDNYKDYKRIAENLKEYALKHNVAILMPVQRQLSRSSPWQPWRVTISPIQNGLIFIDPLYLLK